MSWKNPNNYKNLYFLTFGKSSTGRLFSTTGYFYDSKRLFYSNDYGYTWTQHSKSFSGIYSFITRGDSIFLSTEAGIFLNTDNGNNWEIMNNSVWIDKMLLAPNGDIIGVHYS